VRQHDRRGIQGLIEDFDIIAQYTIKLVQKFKQNESKTD